MKHESGNALWFILLAVALITALTITITSSSDQTEQSGDIERARVQASEILNFAKSVEEGVKRMTMRGISENELSFEDTRLTTDYSHAGCTGDNCLVFGKSGGGVSYSPPNSLWLDRSESASARYGEWFFTSDTCVASVVRGGTDCDADAANNEELLIVMPYIKRDLCTEINYLLTLKDGSGNLLTSPPEQTDAAFDLDAYFQGSFSGDSMIILDDTSYLTGKKAGCFEDKTLGAYMFYYTLIGR